MAKQVKVLSGTALTTVQTIYTVPSGRVAKVEIISLKTSSLGTGAFGPITFIPPNISAPYTSGSTPPLNDTIIPYVGSSVGAFPRYFVLTSDQSIPASSCTYSIIIVEEY